MPDTLTLTHVFQVTPERLYEAWLDPAQHGAMTNTLCSASDDGTFSASDGYITGKTVERVPGQRIVQTWRTTEFPPNAPDSRLVLTFSPGPSGTTLTLEQTDIPEGQGESYESGWREYYFGPMEAYFAPPHLKASAQHALHQAEETAAKVLHSVETAAEGAAKKAKAAVTQVKASAKKGAATVKKKAAQVKRSVTTLAKKAKGAMAKAKAGAKKKPAPKKAAAKKATRPAPKKKPAGKRR